MRKLRKICEAEGCNDPAKYGLNRTKPDGEKEWLYVCRLHERIIGDENMRRAGGRYERVSIPGTRAM